MGVAPHLVGYASMARQSHNLSLCSACRLVQVLGIVWRLLHAPAAPYIHSSMPLPGAGKTHCNCSNDTHLADQRAYEHKNVLVSYDFSRRALFASQRGTQVGQAKAARLTEACPTQYKRHSIGTSEPPCAVQLLRPTNKVYCQAQSERQRHHLYTKVAVILEPNSQAVCPMEGRALHCICLESTPFLSLALSLFNLPR